MTDLEKILLGVGGAGAMYGLYKNWRGIPPMGSHSMGLMNYEEPIPTEQMTEESINEAGVITGRTVSEIDGYGDETVVSDIPPNPYGRAINFPENFPPTRTGAEVSDQSSNSPIEYFRPVNEFHPNPHTSTPRRVFDPRTRTMINNPGVNYPATLGELRDAQIRSGAIHPNAHDPNKYRMWNMQAKNRLMGNRGLL